MSKSILVVNLADGTEQTYVGVDPVEALISAYLIGNKMSLNLSNPITRKNALKKVVFGKVSAGLGDYAVRI